MVKKNTWWVQNLCIDPLCAWEDFTVLGYGRAITVQQIHSNKVSKCWLAFFIRSSDLTRPRQVLSAQAKTEQHLPEFKVYMPLRNWRLGLHPLTALLESSSQVGMVKSKDFDVSQKTRILYSWCGRTFFFIMLMCVLACTLTPPTHTHTHKLRFTFTALTPRNEGSLLQPDLSIYPNAYWFQSQCDLFLCCVATDWCEKVECVCVWKVCCFLAFVYVLGSVWVYYNAAAVSCVRPQIGVCVCVSICTCTVSWLGGTCVVLFVLKVFPHSDPRGGSRRERERKRERECLCCPLTLTHLVLLF